ncbi:MAG: AAA family ATPase [Chloroflexi bacterium]|nr:AAA family ATPase [Chloroflexota bacterium]
MANSNSALEALQLPNGARFFKCALQVNPFDYLATHGRSSSFTDEGTYNEAIIEACKRNSVEVIAITDHHRVKTALSLTEAAKDAGLRVYPGFEATTKDGVHFLCLFDPDVPLDLERVLGACGIYDESPRSVTSSLDVTELLEKCKEWGGLCIAAHVVSKSGLLAELSGQPRVNAWRHENLLAVSLPGPVAEAPEQFRGILAGKDPQYKRDYPVAVINASDVSSPEDFDNPGTSCYIKMTSVSIDGLRLAFLDPDSRIRLSTDPETEDHSVLLSITWQGGFLDQCAIHFNENLNVLIGGRGTGKSTIIESLRATLGLEPLGDEATKLHEDIVQKVLRSGTKISLAVRSYHPSEKTYLIERSIPNPPVVRDEEGNVLPLRPQDILPGLEVYGQHELSELAKSPPKLTRLLHRFLDHDPAIDRRKADVKMRLEQSRIRILLIDREQAEIVDRLAALPGLEEILERFRELGVEERLKDRNLLIREERVLKILSERLEPSTEALELLETLTPVDSAFLSDKALADLPARDLLSEATDILDAFEEDVRKASGLIRQALERATTEIKSLRTRWTVRKTAAQEAYEAVLRELQTANVDGEEYVRLRTQIEELRPLRESEDRFTRERRELQESRRGLVADWESLKGEEFQRLDKAANRVSSQLVPRVRVNVQFGKDREPLISLLREHVGGRVSEAMSILRDAKDVSLSEFADACRQGQTTLVDKYKIAPAQAERLSGASAEACMLIEELELPHTTSPELNTAHDDSAPDWHPLDELSTGQKATAVLLLLLLESEGPLIIDQPEDDLDNRFITEGVVPRMRDEKRRRQFLFATHNANVPVLGDAELIVALEATESRAEVPIGHLGSIDVLTIREIVEDLLEGGREAFETRRRKYNF